jgi:cAMP-dependent protein kinase regulator
MPEKIENKFKKGPRASVSAEAFGEYNKKGDFKAQVINKTEETKAKIAARLNMTFMF